MRTLLAVASVALLVGAGFGCGDDTTTTSVSDMSAVADMTVPHDMQQLTCAQAITCEFNCTDATCQAACIAEANSNAKTLLGLLAACLFNACSPDAGNPNGSCSGAADITSPSCQACLGAAGTAAASAGAPCHTEFTTCESM